MARPLVIDARLALRLVLPGPSQPRLRALTADEARRTLELTRALGVELTSPDEDQSALALDWTLRLKRAAAVPWVHCVTEA